MFGGLSVQRISCASFAFVVLILFVGSVVLALYTQGGGSPPLDLTPTLQYLINNPKLRPRYLASLRPESNGVLLPNEEICVGIGYGTFMEPGDDALVVRDYVAQNTSFSVNGRSLIPFSEVSIDYPGGIREVVNDQETGMVRFCFLTDLESGFHLAELQTQHTHGETYRYSWIFKSV